MTRPAPLARAVVAIGLAVCVLIGLALLAASFIPSETLAGRLLGAAGEARTAGAYTQELAANLDARLRFAAAVLLVLTLGLVLVRSAFEDLVAACTEDALWPTGWPSTISLALIGLTTLLALGLRAPFLSQPMRYDEALTFNEFASRPLYYGLSFYPDPNNHLLNTLLMHLAFVGLGNQPWVLRLPAYVAGALLAPATYALARVLSGTAGAGWLAATLVAASSYLVEYSTNARGYTLQALCFVLTLSLVMLAVRRDSRAALLLAAVLAALGAYAVPTMLYGAAICVVWLLVARRRASIDRDETNTVTRVQPTHMLAAGLALGLGVALLYLPVAIISGADKLAFNRFVVPLNASQLAGDLPRSLLQTFVLWNRDVPLPIAALLLLGFALGTLMDLRAGRGPVLGLLAPGVCLGLVVLQRVAPFERVWLFLLPLYLAIASIGLTRLVGVRWRGRPLGIAAVIGLGAIVGLSTLSSGSILRSTETGAYPDAEAVARSLAPRLAPDDAVLTTLPASLPELQYYFPRSGLPTSVLVRPAAEAQNLYVLTPPGDAPEVPGWRASQEIARFPASTLFELKR
ncbi:MAG TPA: glycosyltransferase family 39 protein [Chloroflexota bacterium]